MWAQAEWERAEYIYSERQLSAAINGQAAELEELLCKLLKII